MEAGRLLKTLVGIVLLAAFGSGPAAVAGNSEARLFIIGQDLGAIRGYYASDCCPVSDGTTAYLDFYNLLSPAGGYGGLGIDAGGNPLEVENSWGSGPMSAWKTATGFDVDYLAVGLSITENDHPGGLDRLVAGRHDAEIRQLAVFANAVEAKILLRIGYEFDGAWNRGYENAPRYVAAYRRVVDGLRKAGVGNVEYVWQGAASTTDMVLDGGRHENIRDWYPGDDYVDWVGLSWFMHPDEQPGVDPGFAVLTPRQLADELLALAREAGKPVLIAEASPQSYDLRDNTRSHHSPLWDGPAGEGTLQLTDDAIWDGWFQPLFDYMNENGDVIRGLAYIDVRWDDQEMWGAPYASGYWGDSRVEVNEEIARRFTRAIDAWRSVDE